MARHDHAEASRKSRRPSTAPSAAAASGRSSQRLLGAITQLTIDGGYTNVTVGQIIARAGVSRATFYEYFDDKEECFVAALAPIRGQLLAGLRTSVASDRPERAIFRVTHGLLAFAQRRPGMARLLMSDSLMGGSQLRNARDGFISDAARIIEEAHGRLPAGAVVADLPPSLICGVTCRLLGARLRGAQSLQPGRIADELLGWIAAYEIPLARHRWRAVATLPSPARSPFLPPSALRAPPALVPGLSRGREGALVENHWLRIVFATVEVIGRDGYSNASVAQITQTAGVDSRAFYRLFDGKQQALAAAGELLFRNAMAVAAGAFVAGEDWPEHVWEAARAVAQYAEQNPTLTYVALVESLAGGACAAGCVEDRMRAFTIFLQEGSSYPDSRLEQSGVGRSEVALEAIGAAVFELAYRQPREDSEATLSRLLAPAVFISLAPFLGVEGAGDFVCRKAFTATSGPPLTTAA